MPRKSRPEPRKRQDEKPASATRLPAASKSADEGTFDLEVYRKQVMADPKAREAIEFFLQHRHREWEESLCEGKERQPKHKS